MTAATDPADGGPSTPPVSAKSVILLAIGFGMATGFAENAVRLVDNLLLDKRLTVGIDTFWLSPLVYAAVFGVIGLAVIVAVRLVSRLRSWRWIVFLFAFLSFQSLGFSFPRIEHLAWLVLALGLALVTTRAALRSPPALCRLVRRTLPVLLVVDVVIAGVLLALPAWREHRAMSRISAPPRDAPNVLLVVLDTVTAEHMSLHGYDRETTPHIAALARRGTAFESAFCPSPWTLPTHASLFTGRLPFEHRADFKTPLDETHPTLAETLHARGYATGGFAANGSYCRPEFGLSRGFARYDDPVKWTGRVPESSRLLSFLIKQPLLGRAINRLTGRSDVLRHRLRQKRAATINRELLDWLDEHEDRPFFAFLNYFDAHGPYVPPAPFENRYGAARPPYPYHPWHLARNYTEERIQTYVDAYDACVSYLDQQVAELLSELERRGREDTLVIVTADHGELFGQHGLMEHGNSLYMPLLHAPLVFVMPGKVPSQRRIRSAVSLVDVPATVLELLEIEEHELAGESLARHWTDPAESPGERSIYAEITNERNMTAQTPVAKGTMKSVIWKGHHLIRNGDGVEELYDLVADPRQLTNVAELPASRSVLLECRAELERFDALDPRRDVSASEDDGDSE